MTPPPLEARGLVQQFGERTALTLSQLTTAPGERIALIGPNGAGKSTLLRILALLDEPTAGTVFLDGAPVTPRDRTARLRIAFLPQKPILLRGSVAWNVGLGLKIRGMRGGLSIRDRVDAGLLRVGLDPALIRDKPHDALSGGEAKRAALAARLVLDPKILLLDEPLAHLDAASVDLVARLVIDAAASGATVLYSGHDLNRTTIVPDRTITLPESPQS